ncbi:MAG TPA: terminase family protein [Candidatus Tectomicrobia bacterium]|nr:terminase family protein [Candidatus Tectomicrobia bacterium]
MALTVAEELELLTLLEAEEAYQQTHRLHTLFPDTGRFARQHYPKHLAFFAAGATHRERLFIAANRVGKTRAACYELALHLTGLYPAWWEGRRFPRPIRAWVAGTTSKKVKEIVQEELFGPVGQWGTGVLPQDTLASVTKAASSVADLIDSARIRHTSGGHSLLTLKYYEQGREAFEGTKQDVILEDEEPPLTIHSECVMRTMDTTGTGRDNGMVLTTFTPLLGLSDTVVYFLPDGQIPEQPSQGTKWIGNASWDDVPHLDASTKAELLATIPAYQREARTRGIPVLGAGVIYPVEESAFLVEPFELPKHYRKAYALDVGWNRTAAVWGAYDREADTWYLYHEHYRGEAEPSVHAAACKAPGAWIRGVVDPAARGRSQEDGTVLLETYQQLGLDLQVAVNAVEAGIYQVWERLTQGRLKVFTSLTNWRKEARLYRRNEKGAIIKQDDHLMDATRYLLLSGLEVARVQPVAREQDPPVAVQTGPGGRRGGWRHTFTG